MKLCEYKHVNVIEEQAGNNVLLATDFVKGVSKFIGTPHKTGTQLRLVVEVGRRQSLSCYVSLFERAVKANTLIFNGKCRVKGFDGEVSDHLLTNLSKEWKLDGVKDGKSQYSIVALSV